MVSPVCEYVDAVQEYRQLAVKLYMYPYFTCMVQGPKRTMVEFQLITSVRPQTFVGFWWI
jgi:hypothetical protein